MAASWSARRISAAMLLGAVPIFASATLQLTVHSERASFGAEIAYLEDSVGRLTIEDIVSGDAARFKRHDGSNLNFGFTDSTYWLRFSVQRAPGDLRQWFLRVPYTLLDHVDLYIPALARAGSPAFILRAGGDQLPFADRDVLDAKLYFSLPGTALAGHALYLRVRSESSLTIPIEMLSSRGADHVRAQEHLVFGLFYGALLGLVLYNTLLFSATRDRSYLYYVLFAATAGLAQFAYNGFAYQFLWPESIGWNNRAPNVLGFLALSLGLVFTRSVLNTPVSAPRFDIALRLLAILSGALAVLALTVFSYGTAVKLFSVIGPAGATVMLASGVVCLVRGYRAGRYFLLAWTALLVGVIVHSLRVLGIFPTNLFTVHAIQIGSALEMLLLSYALADRISTLKHEKEHAQAQALDAARQSERALESKVEQRVQELGALNNALQAEVAERMRAEELLTRIAHHDPLTGLPNRLLLRDRFAIAAANSLRHRSGLALLLLDLDGFKQVNDRFGHDVGDRVLVGVGETLRGCVRESDTVARLGGDEFVVLVGNLGEPKEEAALVAYKIIERLSAPKVISGHYLAVVPSVGVALFGADGTELDDLLKCADRAMYEAKQAGGRAVRFSVREGTEQYQLRLQG